MTEKTELNVNRLLEENSNANIGILRLICKTAVQANEYFSRKGKETLASVDIITQEYRDKVVIVYYLGDLSDFKSYTVDGNRENDYISAFIGVFNNYYPSKLSCRKYINDEVDYSGARGFREFFYGKEINTATLKFEHFATFFKNASEILLKLYETICQKVNYKEATWESFGIQDSDVFKNEIEHLRANN